MSENRENSPHPSDEWFRYAEIVDGRYKLAREARKRAYSESSFSSQMRVTNIDDRSITGVRGEISIEQFRKEYQVEWPAHERVALVPTMALRDGSVLSPDEYALLTRDLSSADVSRLTSLLSSRVSRHDTNDSSIFCWDITEVTADQAEFLVLCGFEPAERRAYFQVCRIRAKDAGLSDAQKKDLEWQWKVRFGEALKNHAMQIREMYGPSSGQQYFFYTPPAPLTPPCDVTISAPLAVAPEDRPNPIVAESVEPFKVTTRWTGNPVASPEPNRNGDVFGVGPLKAAFAAVQHNSDVFEIGSLKPTSEMEPNPSRENFRDADEEVAVAPPAVDDFQEFMRARRCGGTFFGLPDGVPLPDNFLTSLGESCALWQPDESRPSACKSRVLYAPPGWAVKSTGFGTSLFDESGAERCMMRAGDPELPDVIKVYDPNAPLFI